MTGMGATQNYQMKYWGPDTDGGKDQGKRSYANRDTAVGDARSAGRSREHTAPQSHVIVINKVAKTVVFEWHGGEDTEYPEVGWPRVCHVDPMHPVFEVPAVTTVETEYDEGPVPACAECAAKAAGRR